MLSRRRADVLVAWVALVAVALVSVAVRIRLLDVPLDRDEGEYAYMGQLWLHGVPPYIGAYNMKLPGIYALYALVLACFGETSAGVHAGLLVVTGVTTSLLLWLGRRIGGTLTGVASATIFATLTLNPWGLGLAGYAEHYVLPFAVAGALVLLISVEHERVGAIALAGSLFGIATIVKQSGVVFVLFGIAYAGFTSPSLSRFLVRISAVVGGAAVPTVVLAIVLTASGAFPRFWFWTVQYAAEYVTQPTLLQGLRYFGRTGADITPGTWPVLALAVWGLVASLRGQFEGHVRTCPHLLPDHRTAFLVLMLAASLLGVSAGLYFRPQYFLLLAPVVALLAGIAIGVVARHTTAEHRHAAAVVATCVGVPAVFLLAYDAGIFFVKTPTEVSRELYGRNPFVEAVEIARYLRERSVPTDRIAVIGSEPEIYFYARRPAATGYIYTYPLMEAQRYAGRMQEEMIREIEAASPAYLVFVNVSTSWLVRPSFDPGILTWLRRYASDFEVVAVADIVSVERTEYRWDAEARNYAPKSPYSVMVFRRKPT
jgi:4-amino-4-deoxy-L-arabinose transferase-like glycosyltransferase